MDKDTLVRELIECIRAVGIDNECNGILKFNINRLLSEWEKRYPKVKFKSYGFGSFQNFLHKECGAIEVDQISRGYEFNTEGKAANTEIRSHSEMGATATPQVSEKDREVPCCDVLQILQDLIGSDIASVDKNYISLKTNELWKICKEKGKTVTPIEGFKEFLLQSCFAESSQAKQDELRFNRKKINDYLKSRGIGEESYMREHQPPSSMIRDAPELDESRIHVESDMTEEQSENFDEQLHPEETNGASAQTVMESEVQSKGVIICQESGFLDQPNSGSSSTHAQDETRFIHVIICLYDCCLKALRELFKRIHPSWKNQRSDAFSLKRGSLHLKAEIEIERFNTGDIEQWDISLLCKVLLYTEEAMKKLEESGEIKDAIKQIKDIRNEQFTHKGKRELTVTEHEDIMKQMESALETLGFPKEEVKPLSKDLSLENPFFKMYLEEVKSLSSQIDAGNKILANKMEEVKVEVEEVKEELEEVKVEVKKLIDGIQNKKIKQSEIAVKAAKQDPVSWDEWVKVKKYLNDFDSDSNQYILIVDKVEASNTDCMVSLGNIPWKIVFDLDPDSDIDGLNVCINSSNANNGIIVSHTPTQLNDRLMDTNRIQWVFVNGKNKDTDEAAPKSTYEDWKGHFRRPILMFLFKYFPKFDTRKPLFCIVPNMQKSSKEIATDILGNINDSFRCEFDLKFLFFSNDFDLEQYPGSIYSNLSMQYLFFGIHAQLGQITKEYELPSHQDSLNVSLGGRKYNFLSEYLEILYIGCEKIPHELTEKEQDKFQNEHLKSFLKGTLISFESLYYGHDVTRSITDKVSNRIQRISQHQGQPQIVQICHSPGTGGSTIARRVLWKLHEEQPCAIVRMTSLSEIDIADGKIVESLSERIGEIFKICEMMPTILIDGSSRKVINLSDHLVRRLHADGFKALILRVVNPHGNEKQNDIYLPKKNDFRVQSVLQDNQHDLNKFRATYHSYVERFNKKKHVRMETLTRVFHFPMMAMLGEFEKLKDIVKKSLDIVKEEEPVHYEVAMLVAFIQIYSNRETPASVVDSYFSKKTTKNDAREECEKLKLSSALLNLMVSKKARSKEKWIGSKKYWSDYEGESEDEDEEIKHIFDSYTFQHLDVAQIVFEHSKYSLDDMADEFVKSFLGEYKKQNEFTDVINDLFLYSKESQDDHFSRLVMKLKTGGRIFEDAAKNAKDATLYSHVARYFAIQNRPLDFEKAKKLIQEGLEVDRSASKEKQRGVYDAEGHILYREMKQFKRSKQIVNIEQLQKLADNALRSFRRARDSPPMTYPNPLQGEVLVWQFCFDWVIRWKDSKVEEALEYIMTDEFFKTSIADCFYLVDQIDKIVQSVPWLKDPTRTMILANDSRSSLMQLLGRKQGTGREASLQEIDFSRFQTEICKKNFKNADDKELTRLRVSMAINKAKHVHLLNKDSQRELFRLLKKLVLTYLSYEYTEMLLNISRIRENNSYSLDEALKISKDWQTAISHDAFAFFYEYIICFLKVLNGSIFEYRAPYKNALEACMKKCEVNHCKYQKRYFIAKNEDSEKMSRLISQAQLEFLCEKERQNDTGQQKKPAEQYAENLLLECYGRIKLLKTAHGKEYPMIKLEQGNLDIKVERNSLGKAHQDYAPDSRVVFAVYFTLNGPRAKSVHLVDSGRFKGGKLDRQNSKNGRPSKIYCQTPR